MKHSKVKQPDLDKLVPAVIFTEQSEQDKQAFTPAPLYNPEVFIPALP